MITYTFDDQKYTAGTANQTEDATFLSRFQVDSVRHNEEEETEEEEEEEEEEGMRDQEEAQQHREQHPYERTSWYSSPWQVNN